MIMIYVDAMKLNIKKIKKEMKRQSLSYKGLAQKLGKQGRQYGWWILNSKEGHTLSTVNRIAEALDLDPKDLLT